MSARHPATAALVAEFSATATDGRRQPHSAATREKIAAKMRGRKASRETRDKMSVTRKAMAQVKPPAVAGMWAGRALTKAHRIRISYALTGKTLSQATRQKLSEAGKRRSAEKHEAERIERTKHTRAVRFCAKIGIPLDGLPDYRRYREKGFDQAEACRLVLEDRARG